MYILFYKRIGIPGKVYTLFNNIYKNDEPLSRQQTSFNGMHKADSAYVCTVLCTRIVYTGKVLVRIKPLLRYVYS